MLSSAFLKIFYFPLFGSPNRGAGCAKAQTERFYFFKLDTVLQGVETDARAHGGSDGSALEVSALCSSRLCLCNGAHDGIQVGVQLLCTEGSLAHGDMDDVLLVQTILDLTSLGLGDCLAQIILYRFSTQGF